MLVLTRRTNERILIGDDVLITIIAIRGPKVLIGINAPSEVNIARTELIWIEDAERRSKELEGGSGYVDRRY